MFQQAATLISPEGTSLADAVFRFSVHYQENAETPATSSTPDAGATKAGSDHEAQDIFDMPRTHAPYYDVVAEGIVQSSFFTDDGTGDDNEDDLFEEEVEGEDPAERERRKSTLRRTPSRSKRSVCPETNVIMLLCRSFYHSPLLASRLMSSDLSF